MAELSRSFRSLPDYPLADVPEIKRRLRRDGVDVIDLGAGDADLPAPPAAVAALQEAAARPENSRYAFQIGLAGFREEISAWMERRFAVRVDPYRGVLPLIGSKEGIFHLPFALLEPGDPTVVPDPGYQPYLGGTVLAGGVPWTVALRPEHDFLVPLEAIPPEVARRARILYLNYPNNPTTATAPPGYLEEAVEFCKRHEIVLAYDNAYSEIAFDGYTPPSVLEIPGAAEVAIEFHSMSKSYNMTGWRVGWAVGNERLIAALQRVKSFADTGVPLIMQHAAAAVLRSAPGWLPANVEVFRRRRDAVVEVLRAVGFAVEAPRAGMYVWVPLPAGERSSEAFARRLLLEQGVAVLPGAALGGGGEGFFRIALTVDEARLREAVERLGRLS